MNVIPRQVDQWISIGKRSFVGPTDIDSRCVRLLIKGEMFGGADDGAWVERAHELTVGQSVSLGSNVVVTLIAIVGGVARLGVQAPKNLGVFAKETLDKSRKDKDPK